MAPNENVTFAIGRRPYSTALRNVAMVINGNGQRKDSRLCCKLIHDWYRKNGYSDHTSLFGNSSSKVLDFVYWCNLWGLDRSLGNLTFQDYIDFLGDPSTSSIGKGTG